MCYYLIDWGKKEYINRIGFEYQITASPDAYIYHLFLVYRASSYQLYHSASQCYTLNVPILKRIEGHQSV